MRLLAISINGVLDLKNMYPVALELLTKHSIYVDVCGYHSNLVQPSPIYDGLIVGSDWNQNSEIVDNYRASGKKTILLQSEGMFIDENKWYASRTPKSEIACLWGERHRQIFSRRGYQGRMIVTGPPRFDTYCSFVPKLSKEQVYKALKLDNVNQPYILTLGQFFSKPEWGVELFDAQIKLTQFACDFPETVYSIIKCHPQETPELFFSREKISLESGNKNTRVIDQNGHSELIDISTLMYYACAIVSFSSTAALEANMLGVPSFTYSSGLATPLSDGSVATLTSVHTPQSMLTEAARGVDQTRLAKFTSEFLSGVAPGAYTSVAAEAIAKYVRE